MHGGYHDDENHGKKDVVDTISLRDKVKLARSEKWRILKNIMVVSLAFMIQFTAFQVSIKKYECKHPPQILDISRERQTCNRQ